MKTWFTPPADIQKEREVRCTIECQRNVPQANNKQPQSISQSKMDSIIHYITTLPSICNLLYISHQDYLPNEYDPIQVEPDIYFKLITLKHTDGQLDNIHFKLFCYDHDISYLQAFAR